MSIFILSLNVEIYNMSTPLFLDENTLRNDECALEMRDKQNIGIAKYSIENYAYNWPVDCKSPDMRMAPFVYDHPNLHPKIGVGLSDDCLIDQYSSLRNDPASLTKDRCKIQLYERVFQGVPNLKPGRVDPGQEMPLQQGVNNSVYEGSVLPCKKTIMEYTYKEFDPLLPCVKEVQNPEHIVEQWVRGGIPTKDYERRQEFLKNCGYRQANQVKLH